MTYGKANPSSRYMRSHPYRRQPCGSPRPDEEEIKTEDLWKAFGTIKKYVFRSVSNFVHKLTGSNKKTEKKDDSKATESRVNSTALQDSTVSWYNPNLHNTVYSSRQMRYNENNQRQMWLPPYYRPFTQNQSHYPYINDRPQGLPNRSLKRRRFAIAEAKPYTPYTPKLPTYRRAWSVTPQSNARREKDRNRLSSTLHVNGYRSSISQSATKIRPSLYAETDFTKIKPRYKPVYPRGLFSWERGRTKPESKDEDSNEGKAKMNVTYVPPSIQQANDRGSRAGGKMEKTKGFSARSGISVSGNQGQNRKSQGSGMPESPSKRALSIDIKDKSAIDLTLSRCSDVYSLPINKSEPISDVSIESEQKDDWFSDKTVGDVKVSEAPKLQSIKNVPDASSAQSVDSGSLLGSSSNASKQALSGIFGINENTKKTESSSLFAPTSNASKQASSGMFGTKVNTKNTESSSLFARTSQRSKPESFEKFSTNETSEKTGLFDKVINKKTLKPTSGSLGLLSYPEKKDPEKVTPVTVKPFEDTEKKIEPNVKPITEKPKEPENIASSETVAPNLARASKQADDENISFACRMGRLKRIKIRDHYTQKIENLYDSNCTEKDKDAKKAKAVSMYKEKYHKLREDHSFYTKLCKKFNVEPDEEYKGVDPDIKPDEDEPVEDKKEIVAPTFTMKAKEDFTHKIDPKPIADSKPAYVNPFAMVSTPPAPETGKKLFSGGSIFSGSTKPASLKRDRDSSPGALRSFSGSSTSNLFNVTKKPPLFTGANSTTTPPTTNPFSTAVSAGSPKQMSIFGSSSGDQKNNLFNKPNLAVKPIGGGLFGTPSNGGGTASMDSDVPTNNGFSSSNPFSTKPIQTSSCNPFANTLNDNNPFNVQKSGLSGGFGNTQSKSNLFFTPPPSKGPFGSSPGAFNPGSFGKGGGPVFTLGKIPAKNNKKRSIVRGRRTLSM
jgi:hypothetical protein